VPSVATATLEPDVPTAAQAVVAGLGERQRLLNRLAAVAALLALPVVWITVDVLADGPLRHLDATIADASWHQAEPWLTHLAKMVELGGQRAYVCTLLAVVAGVLALRRRTWRPLLVTFVGLLLLNGVVGLAKITLGRSRPVTGHDLLFTADQQFPSGHAANAALSWGLIVWLLVRYGRRALRPVRAYAAAMGLAAVVCAASLYLGYHWLTDLLAGLPLGALPLVVTIGWDVATTGRSAAVRLGERRTVERLERHELVDRSPAQPGDHPGRTAERHHRRQGVVAGEPEQLPHRRLLA
jgi:membrane-associated phospholipid phosphatase